MAGAPTRAAEIGEPAPADVDDRMPRRGGVRLSTPIAALLALAGVLLLIATALIARGTVDAADLGLQVPADSSPEAGFARDMQAHHAQAVEMAMVVRDATDDEAVRLLAYDIALTQQEQIGQMHGWLTQWGLGLSGASEGWMAAAPQGHGGAHGGHEGGAMPGMATPEQMRELATLRGRDAEVRFLTLMIEHHRGALVMAEAALALTDRPEVRRLAQTIVAGQTSEIDIMNRMLRERGAPTV